MGGCGSGGKNKIKQDISQLDRIDSFDKNELIPDNIERVSAKAGIREVEYFKCPICSRRVRFLYEIVQPSIYFCRVCANANYPCQQLPRYRWAMIKILRILDELDVDIDNFDNQLEIMQFEPSYPEYKMSYEKFEKYKDELLKWKIIRHDCAMKIMNRIM